MFPPSMLPDTLQKPSDHERGINSLEMLDKIYEKYPELRILGQSSHFQLD